MSALLALLTRWHLLGGLYLAWGLGANDSSKIFAPAIATNSIRYRTAAILVAVFVILGAGIQGHTLYENYRFSGGSPDETAEARLRDAAIATASAALAIMVSTLLAMPVSSSQAAVGAMIGVAAARLGPSGIDFGQIGTMLACWIATPPAAALLAMLLYYLMARTPIRWFRSVQRRNTALQRGLIIFGCYEAFALGANNVVVTTGPFYLAGFFGPAGPDAHSARVIAALLGGTFIAIGAFTYGHKVMETMSRKITVLDPLSAGVVAAATALTMQVFTFMKVPVSITQAGVGALIGVGLTKGSGGLQVATLKRIAIAWVTSPLSAAAIAWLISIVAIRFWG